MTTTTWTTRVGVVAATIGLLVGASAAPAAADDISGTSGNDYLRGTDGDDVIRGRAGSDNIRGFGGSDRLIGGSGNDFLFTLGTTGPDVLLGGPGDDRMGSGLDDDRLVGGPGNDTMWGSAGDDTIVFRDGDGVDYIQNFGVGQYQFESRGPLAMGFDRLIIDKEGFDSFEDIVPLIEDFQLRTDRRTAIDFGDGDRIIFFNPNTSIQYEYISDYLNEDNVIFR